MKDIGKGCQSNTIYRKDNGENLLRQNREVLEKWKWDIVREKVEGNQHGRSTEMYEKKANIEKAKNEEF